MQSYFTHSFISTSNAGALVHQALVMWGRIATVPALVEQIPLYGSDGRGS